MKQLVDLRDFSYGYPQSTTPALRHVNIRIAGGIWGLTGASGSGKSTLLRVSNGLVPHFHGGWISGAASVAGLDVMRTPTRRLARHVGFLFQDPELQAVYPTVERDVAFGLENQGMARSVMHARVAEALERTGIADLRHRAVHTLSGGERQRCALAGLLALRPQLLVLDEPLSQLDVDGAAGLAATLRRLSGDGVTVLVAEHRLERLRDLCGRWLAMDRGAVAEVGPPQPARATLPPAPRPAATGPAAWALDRLAAGYRGEPVLTDVSAQGRRGEVVVLTGPNGAGKTTLLRTLACLLRPLSGSVSTTPGRVAYLPQNPASLLHRATVVEEVAWTLRHDPAPESPGAVLEELGIGHLAGRSPRDLSAGEQQRVALAAVLAGSPVLALLDEPTRGMDELSRRTLVAAIERLRRRGCAVVLATHDIDLQLAVRGTVLRLRQGILARAPEPEPAAV